MGSWLAVAVGLVSSAQQPGVSVVGVVRDGETKAPLAGAIVALEDQRQTSATDLEGRYRLVGVPPGPQHMLVRRIGYASRTFHALVPAQGTLTIDVALRSRAVSLEPIEVRAALPITRLEGIDSANVLQRGLTASAIRNHPLLAEPDVLQALGDGPGFVRPESADGLHIRGGAADHTGYVLDGFPVFAPYHSGQTTGAWNPDAIARVDLLGGAAASRLSHALGGIVAMTTRRAGSEIETQGAFTTTQARLTTSGPIGAGGAGFLLSLRGTFPGLLIHRRDLTYLGGEGGDVLAKLEAPVLGGGVSLLGYLQDNEITVAADSTGAWRNQWEWSGSSFGASWAGTVLGGGRFLEVRAWRSEADAAGLWGDAESTAARLGSSRRDYGVSAHLESGNDPGRTLAGVRMEWIRTRYAVQPAGETTAPFSLQAATPVATAFVSHFRRVAPGLRAEVSLVGSTGGGGFQLGPVGELHWSPFPAVSASAGISRRHQFAQSLRNPESVVANIFPADLLAGAGDDVPIARSDLLQVALEYRPVAGVRIGAEGYASRQRSVVLVAPRSTDPFATAGFEIGRGSVRGIVLDAAAHGARYGVMASYRLQRVRYTHGARHYAPEHGATHGIDAGFNIFPSPTISARLGARALLGRRGTPHDGAFEWEACNLYDWGCQFVGTPKLRSDALGSASLPAYLRFDLTLRKHWHVTVLGRRGQIGAYGAVTNLLARTNVLTVTAVPSPESPSVAMRPRSPLVVGVDWRF